MKCLGINLDKTHKSPVYWKLKITAESNWRPKYNGESPFVNGSENSILSLLPKLIYSFNAIPIKITGGFLFVEINKLFLNFIWKCKEPRVTKQILKRTKFKSYHCLILRLNKAVMIKTRWYWCIARSRSIRGTE